MNATFHARLRLSVWCEMPTEPPGTVPGQDDTLHWEAAKVMYHALKWIGNPALVPEIVAGRVKPMADRLFDSITRTGEVR
jgi:hypothetical protein